MNLKKKQYLESACKIEEIEKNEFISKDEAYYKVLTHLGSSDADTEAAFLIDLDSLVHMVEKIKEYNDTATRKIAGIRAWKGFQKDKGVNCLEDLVLEPVDNEGNDIHHFGDEPKADNGKHLILAATRPCPHLCGTGTQGPYRFFTNMATPLIDNPYEACGILFPINTTTQD